MKRTMSILLAFWVTFALVPVSLTHAFFPQVDASPGTLAPIVTKIRAGSLFSLALRDDGSVWAWGQNSHGQVGNDSNGDQQAPKKLSLSNIVDIAAFGKHAVALDASGHVWTWGYNGFGQLGNGSLADSYVPIQVPALSGISKIAAGEDHTLALSVTGAVYGWGRNTEGQIDGGSVNTPDPAPVGLPNGVAIKDIAAGGNVSLALAADGTVYAWGDNTLGQTAGGSLATPISGLSGISAISAGKYHAMALSAGGAVYAWGNNSSGQIGNGNGSTGLSIPPYQVMSTGVNSIFAGQTNSFAVKTDGTLWAWGDNSSGQMGLYVGMAPDMNNKLSPVQINPATLPTGLIAVASGTAHTLALSKYGEIKAAGAGMNGQLGAGAAFNALGYFTETLMPYAFLSGLQIFEPAPNFWTTKSISPSFKPNLLSYMTTVSGQISRFGLKLTPPDSNEEILINGSNPTATFTNDFNHGYEIPLSVGVNDFSISVKSKVDNSAVQTYTLQVTRQADTTPPSLVQSNMGKYKHQLALQFDEPLDPNSINKDGFTLTTGGGTIGVESVKPDATGMIATIQLISPLAFEAPAVLDIAQGAVRDKAGNPLAAVSGIAISDNSPRVTYATATEDGLDIDLHFDRPLYTIIPVNSFDFSVFTDLTQLIPVTVQTALFNDDSTVRLHLAASLGSSQTVNLNMGANAVSDQAQQTSQNIVGFPIAANRSSLSLDTGVDGVHIDDIVKNILNKNDITGDKHFDLYDVQYLLEFISTSYISKS